MVVIILCYGAVRLVSLTKTEDAINVGKLSINPVEWVGEPLDQNKPCAVRESSSLLLIAKTDFDYIFEYMPISPSTSPATPESSTAGADTPPNECLAHAIIFQAKTWFDRELTIAKLENQAIAQRKAWVNGYRKSK
ncbi:MAG: hypothetical protein A2568_02590 [Candidatus Yanofskybacteria bacterium RIFOXYD1_FULL_44_17]|nr:MAG: hypothetical protein A2207_03565 [Candidatus Yanofskybacteria bacterium RIFOXYA1_FULL_44_17]OGN36547.1 MAG: hypothetical protein A2241_02320 [Candidatus Yanofskybacteria bacterium RIFOXYA2_FULL_45_28]OGN37111.1 MAG: hypothetical protein A2405_03395 [Candidatus Yanofskybacteria bacterium RIFOXYC1_FULL_44_16]OGN37683.1 MAG: hypothetical protein A2371_01060 [Candidatus Yanofskybacteria bacterium RIFOXYB1_FULL_44_29]OGN37809.1 MAG: hypothetical protein A2302_02365 [Candidatus Yanofskybacter